MASDKITEADIRNAIKALEESEKQYRQMIADRSKYMDYFLRVAIEAFLDEFKKNSRIEMRDLPTSLAFEIRAGLRLPTGGNVSVGHTMREEDLPPSMRGGKESFDRLYDTPYMVAATLGKTMYSQLFLNLGLWREIATGRFDSAKKILGIENMEQRMAALKLYGADKLIEELHAPLLDRSERGNELYLIPKDQGLFLERGTSIDAFFLKYKCPSTGRIYVSGIDPAVFGSYPYRNGQLKIPVRNPLTAMIRASTETLDMPVSATVITRADGDMRPIRAVQQAFRGAADLAMAWKFQITLDQYLNQLTVEA